MSQEQYASTDDKRTEVGNATRHTYRALTDHEKAVMSAIKTDGQNLIDTFETLRKTTPNSARQYSIAITKMEEAVMWAVKGLTK